MHGRRLSATLFGVALVWLGLGSGSAHADFLSSLIANHQSVQVGNLVFDQFSYSPTGQMPLASNVTVIPIVDINGNPGLRFGGGFTDAFDASGPQQASDSTLSYRVTSLGNPLNDIHLFGNPQIIGPGDGFMSVVETFQAGTGGSPIQLEIHHTVNNGVSSLKLQDNAVFGPLPSLQVVTKDILALNLGGVPTLSFIDQTFSTTVAEPGTILVFGLAISTAVGYRWRRRLAADSGGTAGEHAGSRWESRT